MGAQQERHEDGTSMIQDNQLVDYHFYHGLHANEMRRKFKEHVIPILPVVKKVMEITGRGLHSSGKESKLKKVLSSLESVKIMYTGKKLITTRVLSMSCGGINKKK